MNFIKNLWKKIKGLFASLLNKKKKTTKAVPVVKSLGYVAMEKTVPNPTVPEVDNGKIFDNILAMSKEHGYFLSEALNAYAAANTIGLKRIEKQMRNGTYANKEQVSDSVKRFRARKELQAKMHTKKTNVNINAVN